MAVNAYFIKSVYLSRKQAFFFKLSILLTMFLTYGKTELY